MSLSDITAEWEVCASEGTTGIGVIRPLHAAHQPVHFANK